MREILLSKGRKAIIDDQDYEKVSEYNWYVQENKTGIIYAKANDRKNGTTLFMHRLILNIPKGTIIDHVDGDGCNNTRTNLRVCTKQQNAFHSKKMRGCYSKFKGVSIDSNGKCWRSFIKVDGKYKHLGNFKTELEAAQEYNKAAKKYHGDYAWLNNMTLSASTDALSGLPSRA